MHRPQSSLPTLTSPAASVSSLAAHGRSHPPVKGQGKALRGTLLSATHNGIPSYRQNLLLKPSCVDVKLRHLAVALAFKPRETTDLVHVEECVYASLSEVVHDLSNDVVVCLVETLQKFMSGGKAAFNAVVSFTDAVG